MTRNWECGVSIENRREVKEIAKLMGGFGARQAPQSWDADEIERLRQPVRILRDQLPPIRRLPTLEVSELPPIHLRRELRRPLLEGFTGWTRLVLQAILIQEDAFFTLDQVVAACAPLAAEQFPQNRFVRPQIRKQLQRLRDLGLVEVLGGGNYRRTVNS